MHSGKLTLAVFCETWVSVDSDCMADFDFMATGGVLEAFMSEFDLRTDMGILCTMLSFSSKCLFVLPLKQWCKFTLIHN